MKTPFDDIANALTGYFDGIHEGDTEKLRRAFLPNAHLYSATDGAVVDMDLDAYMDLVGGRASPASQGAKRHDRIVAIDLSGPVSATAKVELAVPPKYFTDSLSMLKVDGHWRIVAKTYHYVIHE